MNSSFKTPVSFLQELCIKRGITPTYQDLHSNSPSHVSTFVCEVTCKEFITQGQGTSKKEAKHAAAEKMLEKLKNCPEFNFDEDTNRVPITDDTTVPSPYEHKLKENAVGSLTEYCAEYRLPQPIYKLVREEGPAHDKRFTKQCFIKSFAVEATERTKKQAKQMVALQMISLLKNTIEPRARQEMTVEISDLSEDFQKALANFSKCGTNFHGKFHPGDLTTEIMNDNLRYEEIYRNYKELILEFTESVTEDPEEKLNLLLEKLEISYNLVPVKNNDPNLRIVILNIDFSPSLNVYQFGSSYVEASRKAASKALRFIRTLCIPTVPKETAFNKEEFEALFRNNRTK